MQVRSSGPMAPMWEAMGGLLLLKFARGFAEQLKAGIETSAAAAAGETRPDRDLPDPEMGSSLLARLFAWLRGIFGNKGATT